MEQFVRTEMLIGEEALKKLRKSSVIIFGIGGVGSFTAEALARSGVGHLCLVDKDTVDITNINRQLIAMLSTVGCAKVDVMKERILDINPEAKVEACKLFYGHKTSDDIDFSCYDYVVDAVDNITAKLLIIENAKAAGVPVISSMGAGNKLDPTGFTVSDISKTSYDPLAKVMRKELRDRGIENVKVVYSKEEPIAPAIATEPTKDTGRRSVPGSAAFVPSVCGLVIAGEVIKDLI